MTNDYDVILEEMLSDASKKLDTREWSPVYVAIAPSAAQNAATRFYADNIMDATMVDTATGDNLTRKCAEHGVYRFPASAAVRLGLFTDFNDNPVDVPISSMFGINDLVYTAVEKLSTGVFKLECRTAGEIGNQYFGAILPISNLNLGSANLSTVIVYGEDEETDEALRARFRFVKNSRPFGGNVYQYQEELSKIQGIGDYKVFPTPNDEGGRVHLVIVAPDNIPVSSEFTQYVEDLFDPPPKGKGYGIAPIDHNVTVSTVTEVVIGVYAKILLDVNFTIEMVKPGITEAINVYLKSIAFKDPIVRIERIEREILGVTGVIDITGTKLNNQSSNIQLPAQFDNYAIPLLGTVQLEKLI